MAYLEYSLATVILAGLRRRSVQWCIGAQVECGAVAKPSDLEARLTALEARIEEVAADAAAARHLAAARDRDLADLGVKVDANRIAINALGLQTTERFDVLETQVGTGFTEMRGKLDQTAAGLELIANLLTPPPGESGEPR